MPFLNYKLWPCRDLRSYSYDHIDIPEQRSKGHTGVPSHSSAKLLYYENSSCLPFARVARRGNSLGKWYGKTADGNSIHKMRFGVFHSSEFTQNARNWWKKQMACTFSGISHLGILGQFSRNHLIPGKFPVTPLTFHSKFPEFLGQW